jgi:prepilin-type N-terminal cleavage/methylation domain-containing protein/prepilin-type processing-associated H-X9-DG protein
MNSHSSTHPAAFGATHAARGFTLVETLVVVGIIGVLMAMIVPAMSKIRSTARAGQCQANLRQLGLASASYATQNADRYPAAILYEMGTAGLITKAWDFEQHPGGVVKPGAIWNFISSPSPVQQCPEFLGSSTFGADPYTGYNYNTSYIGAEGRFPETDANGQWLDGWKTARRGLASGMFRRTSTTALFGDGGWKGGANKFMRAPSGSVEGDMQTVYAGGQAFRHGGCSHVCYLDGHVAGVCDRHEGMHAEDSPLRQVMLEQIMGFPQNAFLADDDRPYDPR